MNGISESWRKLWTEVGNDIGVQFEVDGETKPVPEKYVSIGHTVLQFSVRRL